MNKTQNQNFRHEMHIFSTKNEKNLNSLKNGNKRTI